MRRALESGRVHEIGCRWVQGAVAKHPDLMTHLHAD